jgi:hypothetical protein
VTTPIDAKVAHVKRAAQDRAHACHWPGCISQCPPALWGCRTHWYRLPQALRSRIWRSYRIGQERDGKPSAEYLQVAREIQQWIRTNYPNDLPKGEPA